MKSAGKLKIITLLICFFLLSDIAIAFQAKSRSTRRHHRRLSKRSHHKSHTKGIGSFGTGLLFGLTGATDIKEWNDCLPSDWKITAVYEANEKAKADAAVGQLKTTLGKVKDALKTAATVLCGIRSGVKAIIGAIVGDKRRKRMMFMERRTHVSKAQALKNFFDDIVTAATKLGIAVVTGVKSAWTSISSAVQQVFMDLKDTFKSIYNTVKGWLESPTLQKLKTFVGCIGQVKTLISAPGSIIKGITTKITGATTALAGGPVGIALWVGDLLAALLCAWEKFNAVYGFIVTALDPKTTADDKWHYWGRAVGTFINAMATADRRRHRKH